MISQRSKKSHKTAKNPYVSLEDEPDYLSETFIEEQEAEKKRKEQENKPQQVNPPTAEVNANEDSDKSNVLEADEVNVQQREQAPAPQDLGPRSITRSPVPAQRDNNPQPAPTHTQTGQSANPEPPRNPDDELFNSVLYRNNNGEQNNDEFDFDFESSDHENEQQNNGPNPNNFETNVRRN